jgi:hypothetical protein
MAFDVSRNSISSKVGKQRSVRRLDEQVRAPLSVGAEAQLVVTCLKRPQQVHLAPRHELEPQTLGGQALAQLATALRELARNDPRVVGPDVRVAAAVSTPSAAAARANSIAASMSWGPSSTPGSRWQWRSTTTAS